MPLRSAGLPRPPVTELYLACFEYRAANTGLSCVLDSRGRLLDRLPEGKETTAVFTAPLGGVATPYRRLGDWPVVLMLAAALGAVPALRWRRQRARLNSTAFVQT
jgi:apolipoprotein N-acyltransferase